MHGAVVYCALIVDHVHVLLECDWLLYFYHICIILVY